MADLFVGPVVEKLMEKVIESLSHYVQDQFRWQTGMKKELESLRDNQLMIQAVLCTVSGPENVNQNSPFNKWIWQLRDAIDEVDDLLDDLEYKKHQQHKLFQKYIEFGERLLKTDPFLKSLEEAVQKLDRISGKASIFLELFKSIKQEQQEQEVDLHTTRETGSSFANNLIGRGKDKKFIIQWLRETSNEAPQTHATTTTLYHNISLLSIVGLGGMGKTTLLQHIYDDEITEEFQLKMWVCVSDSFDVKKVIADMLESVTDNRPSLQSLQNRLKSKVNSKKFLLVLDDLWDKEEYALRSKWESVLAPLTYGGLGSIILITTRADSVASLIANVLRKNNEVLTLKGLEDNECLELLTTHAFANVGSPDDHKKLTFIAKKLVKKFYGSPLVAKVMGGVLNSSLDESHWRNVLNNSMDLNDISNILKLSYKFLPKHLQSCFSFCSIFAQDHVFDKDDLVRMWIAVGFIPSCHNIHGKIPTLENTGKSYFDVLIKKSFFDEAFFADGSLKGYKMHDLLHELAQFVSKQECFRIVGDENSLLLEIPETTRHLSVETINPEVLKQIGRFKNLQTLLITCYHPSFFDVLNEMFKETKSIRLLHINDITLEVILEAIEYLHHLRYLRFPASDAKQLPRSLSSLFHLQFIIVGKYTVGFSNDFFPMGMNNLSNLRYLSIPQLNFPGIGRLKFLQQLKEFNIKNEDGYRIEELKDMNDLSILQIANLKDVRNDEDAGNAKLCDKTKLTNLSLDWDMSRSHEERNIADRDLDESVLDKLQPHNYLKTLQIKRYMGAKSAIWMKEADLITNLDEIELSECLEWEILPPFGQLPFLKTLKLYKMPKVKQLENKFEGNGRCGIFPSLVTLCFENLEALVNWFDPSVEGLFPSLTEAHISNCPNLQELPYSPPKLETLEITNVGWKTLNCCSQNITSIFQADEISKLKNLTIKGCPNLISLGEQHQEVDATENFQLILDHLIISDPSVLQIEPLRRYTSTKSLIIEDNDKLVSFPFEAEQWFRQVSSSLRGLTFKNLRSVQSLPSSLTEIPSLEILKVKMLPKLRELPDLPPSLKKFRIKKCNSELMKRHKQFSIYN